MNNEKNKFIVPTNGLTYIPRWVKQESDMEFGSVVSHENYNEKLNLNTMQGDYNTEVLRHLFTDPKSETNCHIAYIDKTIQDLADYADARVDEIEGAIDHFDKLSKELSSHMDEIDTNLLNILNGVTKPKVAQYADKITGIESAGNHVYYGTDYTGNIGFHILPDPIYAEDMSSGSVDISGIYFTPRPNSITETMLNEEIRTKINRATISDYDVLENRPKINNILLTGNVSLSALGIQPVGNYLTSVPDTYATFDTTKTWVNGQLDSYYTKEQSDANFAPKSTTATGIANAQSAANNAQSTANSALNTANNRNTVYVQGSEPYGARAGDIWIKV